MGFFSANDGLALRFESQAPPGAKAAIVFMHGLGEHIGRYQAVFEFFSRQGYACFGFDQRGFGLSPGERGHIDSFAQYVDDLDCFIRRVSAELPGKPLYLFGHSMGAVVVLSYALRDGLPIRAMLVFSCPLRLAQWPGRVFGHWAAKLAAFFPKLKLPNLLDPQELSNNPALIQAYLDDPLVEKSVSLKWLREFDLACGHIRAQASQITLPILLAHGACDRIADVAGAEWLFRHLGSQDKTLQIYAGMKHELLNHRQSDSEKVLEAALAWLGRFA